MPCLHTSIAHIIGLQALCERLASMTNLYKNEATAVLFDLSSPTTFTQALKARLQMSKHTFFLLRRKFRGDHPLE